MKISAVLVYALVGMNAAHATSPACQDMVDKVTKKFEGVKKMPGPSAAKCQAISLVISDLTDMYSLCVIKAQDEKFIDKPYKPLALAIQEEAAKSCQR